MQFSKRTVLIGVSAIALFAAVVAMTPRLLPCLLSWYRSDIWFSIPAKERRIFLTVDDAPSGSTHEILTVLKKHHVPATFFVIGNRVNDPGQLREIVRDGHSLGNHLKTTRACSTLSLEEFRSSLDACSEILLRDAKPRFFRPASDFGTREQISYANSKGYQAVMGTVFPLDHWISDPAWLNRLVRWLAVPGGILIMHDGAVRGRTTAGVLDDLIPRLKAAGYSFGRVEEGLEAPRQSR